MRKNIVDDNSRTLLFICNVWAGDDLEFKFALWESVKLWLSMVMMIIPGGILYLVTKD